MVALDAGCGMGFFSLDLARLVGSEGRVVCVDLQGKMIETLVRREAEDQKESHSAAQPVKLSRILRFGLPFSHPPVSRQVSETINIVKFNPRGIVGLSHCH